MLGGMEMDDPVGGAPGFSSLSLGYNLLGNSEVGAGASVSVTLTGERGPLCHVFPYMCMCICDDCEHVCIWDCVFRCARLCGRV